MKRIVLATTGDFEKKVMGTVELVDVPRPLPGPEDVLVKVAYASICGSDGHYMRGNLGKFKYQLEALLPMPLGHEVSGVIEAVGETAAQAGFKPGDRVCANFTHYCNSCYYCRSGRENFCEHPTVVSDGMSEYICWHMSQIFHVPDDISLLHASQAEPLSVALNAVKTVGVHFGDNVAVYGAGPIGLMVMQLCKLAGASTVTAFEIVPEKRELAKTCGADFAYDSSQAGWKETAISEVTQGRGFDKVIETSGATAAASTVLDIMGFDSHAVFFAMYDPAFELKIPAFEHLYRYQKHIHGMYTSADVFEESVRMLRNINFEPIIHKIYSLDEYQQAFQDQLSAKYAKLVFEVNPAK